MPSKGRKRKTQSSKNSNHGQGRKTGSVLCSTNEAAKQTAKCVRERNHSFTRDERSRDGCSENDRGVTDGREDRGILSNNREGSKDEETVYGEDYLGSPNGELTSLL